MSYTNWFYDKFSFLFDAGIDSFDWTYDPTTAPPSPPPIPFPNIGGVTFFEVGDVIDLSGDSGVVIIAAQDADTDLTITINQDGATENTGTVKWFNPTKGYGFIEPEDGSKDVFDTAIHTGILTGNGNDTIDVNLSGGGSYLISAGGGEDTVTVAYHDFHTDVAGPVTGLIDGGADDDMINVSYEVDTGSAGVMGPSALFQISGGEGNDAEYLKIKFDNAYITSYQTGGSSGSMSGDDGNDTLIFDVVGQVGGPDPAASVAFKISGGAGDDILGGVAGTQLIGGTNHDIFLLGAGTNTGTIMDFTDGEDMLGLTGGLTFERLAISEQDGNTYITDTANGGAVLATLKGLHAAEIDLSDLIIFDEPTFLV